MAGQLPQADGKIRTLHLRGENSGQAFSGALEAEDADVVGRIVSGLEEGEPLHVVPVRMGNDQCQVERLAPELRAKRFAERADAGAGVENDEFAVPAKLDARGIAAIANGVRSRGRNRAAHAPEPN